MAIVVSTDTPKGLLAAIKAEIDAGRIETWEYDSDGDFTHSPEQWRQKAWLRPSTGSGELVLGILGPTNQKMSRVVYAVYHGRFIEMLLTHFDLKFTKAIASALPERGDII